MAYNRVMPFALRFDRFAEGMPPLPHGVSVYATPGWICCRVPGWTLTWRFPVENVWRMVVSVRASATVHARWLFK